MISMKITQVWPDWKASFKLAMCFTLWTVLFPCLYDLVMLYFFLFFFPKLKSQPFWICLYNSAAAFSRSYFPYSVPSITPAPSVLCCWGLSYTQPLKRGLTEVEVARSGWCKDGSRSHGWMREWGSSVPAEEVGWKREGKDNLRGRAVRFEHENAGEQLLVTRKHC